MQHFLFWIGLYNALGAFLLMSLHNEKFADTLLRKWTEIISANYVYGSFGKLWLWWAASANLFLGGIMMMACRWPSNIQREVIVLALVTYLIMYLVMLVGGKKPTFGRGIIVTHFLWIAQISWGLYAYFVG